MAQQSDSDIGALIMVGLGAFLLISKSKTVGAGPLTTAQINRSIATPQNPRSGSDPYNAWVQSSLNQLNSAGLVVDGIMGPLTRQAVMKFQEQWGIVADGVVSAETDYDLRAAMGQQGYTDQPYDPSSPTWYQGNTGQLVY